MFIYIRNKYNFIIYLFYELQEIKIFNNFWRSIRKR